MSEGPTRKRIQKIRKVQMNVVLSLKAYIKKQANPVYVFAVVVMQINYLLFPA